MDNATIKQVSSAKYLGITINESLNWSEHISAISKKSSSVLDFLRRNLKNPAPYIRSYILKNHVTNP